mmetsp:Transcript_62978/g.117804  ORF Transcript_62978/g.117804 Transcript_62978/m.117804 type:complete len:318 (+) Transcript_62978:55-1008(+)
MDVAGVQLQEIGTVHEAWPRLLSADEVNAILAVAGNHRCADCTPLPGSSPSWASVTYGVVLCSHAAGRHRSLGTHVSRVLSLTLDKWDQEDYEMMLQSGNQAVNAELEYWFPEGFQRPTESGATYADFARALDIFVRSKYQEKSFTKSGSGKLVESSFNSASVTTVASIQFCGVLMVRLKSARQLIALDLTSQSDPYVVAELIGGQQHVRTRSIKNCADPVWDETLLLNVRNLSTDVLRLCVWDADTFSQDDAIGHCEIPLRQISRCGSGKLPPQPISFDDQKLTGGDDHSCICIRLLQRNKPRGYLSVDLTFQSLE